MWSVLAQPRRAGRTRAGRTRQIARVLVGHGLESIAGQLGPQRIPFPFIRVRPEAARLSQAERLRLALGELGATFIKLGQMLSTRADLLPTDVILELSKLQDAAPPVPFEEVDRVLQEDLANLPRPVFAHIARTPLASASIGQVHAAVLRDGTPVAVKVRRPGVVEQVELDLGILAGIVDWAQTHTPLGRDYALRPLYDEFAATLRDELDYVREGRNCERFRLAFEGDPGVTIPRVFEEYTTARVLTMERVNGIKITDLATLDRIGIPRRAIAENAVRLFLREILEFGFFHADPHPGNFFVHPDGSLAIVDFGMVGRLSEATNRSLHAALTAAARADSEELAEALYALGVAGPRANRARFERDLAHLVRRFGGSSIAELSAKDVIQDLTAVIFRHKLQLPSELALLLRVINMGEGIGLMLDPGFRYFDYAGPIVQETWKRRYAPSVMARRAGRAAVDAVELGLDLPRRASRLLGRLERGETQLTVEHRGLERLTHEFQTMTNRLALAIVLAASVIALSLAAGIRLMPSFEPILGWLLRLGLLFSLIFGASLIWDMWRSQRR
jgi:ubiquinone biosynthesis protein